jgi:ABC-type amino acid transport substrate-binding protein
MQRAFALLLASLSSTACAFTNIPLTLPTKGLESTIAGGNGRAIVVAIPFSDEREIRDRCGMQKNGYDMDTADAVCQSDPNAWLAQLLADELRASGFTVLPATEPHEASAVEVDGSLLKLFVEPVQGAWSGSLEADLSVKLHLTSGNGLDAERTFFVKGWKGGQLVSTMQPYHTALHRATQDLLAQMVHAIVELMDRYPQLGTGPVPASTEAFEIGNLQ